MTKETQTAKTPYGRFKGYHKKPLCLKAHAAFNKVLKEETEELNDILDIYQRPTEKYIPGDHGEL